MEWLKRYSADSESSRCICWNFKTRNGEIEVFDTEQQPESSLLCIRSVVCVSATLNKKRVSESVFGLSHIFNRWTPLKGGGDGLCGDVSLECF